MKTKSKAPKPIQVPARGYFNWLELQEVVREMGEAQCHELLAIEQAGRARNKFILRIHSRINRLRAQRERQELSRG
jgi:hypothetical protein